MARTRTLAQLQTSVRLMTDTVNDGHITDAFLLERINDGIAGLWDILVGCDPSRHRVSATMNATAGTLAYELPEDFHSAIALDFVRGDERYPVEEFKFDERTFGLDSYVDAYGIPRTRYEIAGQGIDGSAASLRFDRDPGTNTYELHYVQCPQLLADAGDTFDGVAGWEEWVIRTAAIAVCERQERDTSVHFREREKIEQRIRVYAAKRDQHR